MKTFAIGDIHVPQEHIDFLKGGQLWLEREEQIFVHGGFNSDISLSAHSAQALVWDRSLGKCASGISGAVGSTIAVLSPKKGLNTKFLEYFIRRSKNYILETSTGTGLQHINKSLLIARSG